MHTKIDHQYVDEAYASAITGMSPAWYQRARWAGNGPPYVNVMPYRKFFCYKQLPQNCTPYPVKSR
jgi:hypothetical protein